MKNLNLINYLKLSIKGFYLISLSLIILFVTGKSSFNKAYALENLSLDQEIVIANNNLTDQLNQGKLYYENGQYNLAISIWENVLSTFQETGDILNYSLTLRYLASAYDELGNLEKANQVINNSLNQLETITQDSTAKNQILAQVLSLKGKLELTQGKAENALNTWQKAEEIYILLNNKMGILGSKINQAQAYQSLGMYLNAKDILTEIKENLIQETDISFKIIGFKNLGTAYYLLGKLDDAENTLNEALILAQNNNYSEISGINLSLGNIYLERSKQTGKSEVNIIIKQASEYYQTAIDQTEDLTVKLKSELNLLNLLSHHQDLLILDTNELISKIESQINQLNLSRFSIETKVNFAQRLMEIKPINYQLKTAQILAQAVNNAQELQDQSSEAYAMGILGKLYYENGQIDQGLQLTENALKIAQGINTPYIIASLQIQLGKIYQEKGDKNKAISTYTTAVQTLQILRKDLVSDNPNLQFSFRENVEPVYRQLVELLLENPEQDHLKQARQIIEDLQLAELDNFFKDACLNKQVIENIDPRGAVIYPIILPQSLAVIVSFPNQPLFYHQIPLKQEEIKAKFIDLRTKINPFSPNQELLKISQEIYQLIIAPMEQNLQDNNIKTLVFVLDGVMRNVPMSVLHDGEQYLIEKYSIASTPGLQLIAPKTLDKEQLRLLLGALSKETLTFPSLPNIAREAEQISQQNPSELLLNEEFTNHNLQALIRQLPYPVVHLATHGQFSSNINETFIVSWNDTIGVEALEEMIKGRDFTQSAPIEMLVLSACQTASGDERAALGLAGIAVRSGARSTLASLWSVSDNSTAELMVKFYENLNNPNLNKAEALRQAQLTLLHSPEYKKPYYWSSFVLIGNWL